MFDLGVSSPQLDDAERRLFLYERRPAGYENGQVLTPYGMRYSERLERRGAENGYFSTTEKREYAPSIARAIVKEGRQKKIETTFELVDIIKIGNAGRGAQRKTASGEKELSGYKNSGKRGTDESMSDTA